MAIGIRLSLSTLAFLTRDDADLYLNLVLDTNSSMILSLSKLDRLLIVVVFKAWFGRSRNLRRPVNLRQILWLSIAVLQAIDIWFLLFYRMLFARAWHLWKQRWLKIIIQVSLNSIAEQLLPDVFFSLLCSVRCEELAIFLLIAVWRTRTTARANGGPCFDYLVIVVRRRQTILTLRRLREFEGSVSVDS